MGGHERGAFIRGAFTENNNRKGGGFMEESACILLTIYSSS